MGLLDFLFPTLMAAESHAKAKQQKVIRQTHMDLNQSYEAMKAENRYVEENFTNINADYDTKWDYTRQEDETDPAKYFVWCEFIESLPSYDPSQPENDRIFRGLSKFSRDYPKRLAEAKQFGKFAKTDIFFVTQSLGIQPPIEHVQEWWGRERDDYEGQIYHETMQQWHLFMKEHGFPYDLMVVNKYDNEERRLRFADGECVLDVPKYRGGNRYFWNLNHMQTCSW